MTNTTFSIAQTPASDIQGNKVNIFFLDCNLGYVNNQLKKFMVPVLCEFDAAFYYLLGQHLFSDQLDLIVSNLRRDHAEDMASNN